MGKHKKVSLGTRWAMLSQLLWNVAHVFMLGQTWQPHTLMLMPGRHTGSKKKLPKQDRSRHS